MDKNLEKVGIKTRQRIYDFLIQFFKDNSYAPSVREICQAVDLSSTSSVYNHLMTLERMGKIHIEPRKTRAIRIICYEFRKEEEEC